MHSLGPCPPRPGDNHSLRRIGDWFLCMKVSCGFQRSWGGNTRANVSSQPYTARLIGTNLRYKYYSRSPNQFKQPIGRDLSTIWLIFQVYFWDFKDFMLLGPKWLVAVGNVWGFGLFPHGIILLCNVVVAGWIETELEDWKIFTVMSVQFCSSFACNKRPLIWPECVARAESWDAYILLAIQQSPIWLPYVLAVMKSYLLPVEQGNQKQLP